jgi:hypothetical protein
MVSTVPGRVALPRLPYPLSGPFLAGLHVARRGGLCAVDDWLQA